MSERVLVTCGEQRSALAIVRSLGHAGYDVGVCSASRRSLAGASRWARRHDRLPDPGAHPSEFTEALLGLVRRDEVRVLLPVTEPALLAALPLGAQLDDTVIPFSSYERFAAICDKGRVFEAARAEGIAVPREVVFEGPSDAGRAADMAFPVVAKPARSVSRSRARTKHTVAHASSEEELADVLNRFPAEAYPVHIQQRIVGPGEGVFTLSWGGERLAAFAHRRLREKPPSGGVSVYRESIAVDGDLLDRSQRLLDRFAWDGVAMVEYKVDSTSGERYLMEINARFWGSLELAIAAGVDFPRLLVDAALGKPVESVRDYCLGVRSRWEWGDVDHLLLRLGRSSERLALPPDAPGRLATARAFLASCFAGRPEVFRLGDPKPFLRESIDWFGALGPGSRA